MLNARAADQPPGSSCGAAGLKHPIGAWSPGWGGELGGEGEGRVSVDTALSQGAEGQLPPHGWWLTSQVPPLTPLPGPVGAGSQARMRNWGGWRQTRVAREGGGVEVGIWRT